MFLMQTHTSILTCMVEEMLERERPSRSDRRLEEKTEDFGVFVGVGETEGHGENTTVKQALIKSHDELWHAFLSTTVSLGVQKNSIIKNSAK